LRDIGYSCETALADIIDNSITAGAHTIEILSELDGDDPALAVLDDGAGMMLAELIEAMRPGSRSACRKGWPRLGPFWAGLEKRELLAMQETHRCIPQRWGVCCSDMGSG
jgi:hypothetical protein